MHWLELILLALVLTNGLATHQPSIHKALNTMYTGLTYTEFANRIATLQRSYPRYAMLITRVRAITTNYSRLLIFVLHPYLMLRALATDTGHQLINAIGLIFIVVAMGVRANDGLVEWQARRSVLKDYLPANVKAYLGNRPMVPHQTAYWRLMREGIYLMPYLYFTPIFITSITELNQQGRTDFAVFLGIFTVCLFIAWTSLATAWVQIFHLAMRAATSRDRS